VLGENTIVPYEQLAITNMSSDDERFERRIDASLK